MKTVVKEWSKNNQITAMAGGVCLSASTCNNLLGELSSGRGRAKQKEERRMSSKNTGHITPTGGNVFTDLGFAPEEAEELKADRK